jgi:hypothetical protein
MHCLTRIALGVAGASICTVASAFQLDRKLLMYPNGRNMNDMPAAAAAIGVRRNVVIQHWQADLRTLDGWA